MSRQKSINSLNNSTNTYKKDIAKDITIKNDIITIN